MRTRTNKALEPTLIGLSALAVAGALMHFKVPQAFGAMIKMDYAYGNPQLPSLAPTSISDQNTLAQAFGIDETTLTLSKEGEGPTVNGTISLSDCKTLEVKFLKGPDGTFMNTMILGRAAIDTKNAAIVPAVIRQCDKMENSEPKFVGTNPATEKMYVIIGKKRTEFLYGGASLKDFVVGELVGTGEDKDAKIHLIAYEGTGYFDDPSVGFSGSGNVNTFRINFAANQTETHCISVPVGPKLSGRYTTYQYSRRDDGAFYFKKQRKEFMVPTGNAQAFWNRAGKNVFFFGEDQTELSELVSGGIRR